MDLLIASLIVIYFAGFPYAYTKAYNKSIDIDINFCFKYDMPLSLLDDPDRRDYAAEMAALTYVESWGA